MKTTFLTLFLLVFGFSTFAFTPSFPAESSVSENETAIKVKSEAPVAKKETKAVSVKDLSKEMEANYEANKKNMNFKERLANKLILKKLKKAEKKEIKGSKESKLDSGLALLFRIIGIVFIIAGALAVIGVGVSGIIYGIILIALGLLAIALPSII